MKQADIALNELEPRMRLLTRQVRKLAKRQEIEKKLKDLQKNYYSSLWNRLSNEELILNENLKKLNAKKKMKENELENIQQKMQKIIDEKTDRQYDLLQTTYQNLLNLKNEYLEKSAEIKARIILERQKKYQAQKKQEYNLDVASILERLKEISEKQHQF